jgi:UTP-glucose-1-phosphate uridylyltransferase
LAKYLLHANWYKPIGETGGCALAVQEVPLEQTRQYGIVAGTQITATLTQVTQMVEKPSPEKAPSTLAVAGRYVLTPNVFDELVKGKNGVGGEIQLTDAIEKLTSAGAYLRIAMQGTDMTVVRNLGSSRPMWIWPYIILKLAMNLPNGFMIVKVLQEPISFKRLG